MSSWHVKHGKSFLPIVSSHSIGCMYTLDSKRCDVPDIPLLIVKKTHSLIWNSRLFVKGSKVLLFVCKTNFHMIKARTQCRPIMYREPIHTFECPGWFICPWCHCRQNSVSFLFHSIYFCQGMRSIIRTKRNSYSSLVRCVFVQMDDGNIRS
jgi:hypothetical protein